MKHNPSCKPDHTDVVEWCHQCGEMESVENRLEQLEKINKELKWACNSLLEMIITCAMVRATIEKSK